VNFTYTRRGLVEMDVNNIVADFIKNISWADLPAEQ
jgi:hypothetical protein